MLNKAEIEIEKFGTLDIIATSADDPALGEEGGATGGGGWGFID